VASFFGLTTFALLNQAHERSIVRDSLRKLDGYEMLDNLRDSDMLDSGVNRFMAPALKAVADFGLRFTPQDYLNKAKRKLVLAGKPEVHDYERFVATRVLSLLGIPLAYFLAFKVLSLSGSTPLLVFVLISAAAFMGPDVLLTRAIADRQLAIRVKLPDILDLLTVSVEAGLGLDQAIDRTISAVPGPLSDEFGRMLNETRAGSSRADAMRAMEERMDVAEVRSFVMAMLQADTFGVSISRVLRNQGDEMRIKRRQLAQERAQKVPVKMLVPMVFCIFPALFVVTIGPAVLNIIHNFH
jgi:tight adherence protein C